MQPASGSQAQAADILDEALNRRIVRNSAWVGLGYGGGQLLAFVGTLVLAHLLAPNAFGAVAVGMTLLAVVSQVQESGLGAAFVHGRNRNLTAAGACVLAFSTVSGVVLTILAVAIAPLYTRLLHVPESTRLVQVLALTLAIRGVAVLPGAILERDLDFRSRTHADLGGSIVQTAVAISCAIAGLGAWSLVAGVLAGSAVQSGIMWYRAPWFPSPFAARWSMLREMLRYGRFVTGANLMVLVNTNMDNVTVARVLGASALGAYNVAWRLAGIPNTVIGVIVGRVMFSVYSGLQHNLAAVRTAYVQNLQRTMLLALPVTVALGIAADPVVRGLLGTQWTEAVGPLRLLTLFGLVRLLVAPSGELFKGIGRPHLTLLSSTVFASVALPALAFLTPRLGASGAALAMVTGISASGVTVLALTFRALELRPIELAVALVRPSVCALLVGVAVAAVLPTAEALAPLAALLLVVAVGSAVFLLAVALLGRPLLVPVWTALRRS